MASLFKLKGDCNSPNEKAVHMITCNCCFLCRSDVANLQPLSQHRASLHSVQGELKHGSTHSACIICFGSLVNFGAENRMSCL